MRRRGVVLLAVLVLIVLGAAVAAATLGLAESAVDGARSSRGSVDRLLRARSGLILAGASLERDRRAILGGARASLDAADLGSLGSENLALSWGSGGMTGGSIGTRVPLEPAGEWMRVLATARGLGETAAWSWEPEVCARDPEEAREGLAEAYDGVRAEVRDGAQAGLMESLRGGVLEAGSGRAGVARSLLGAGVRPALVGRVLDAWDVDGEAMGVDRTDLNHASAERLCGAGLAEADAAEIVRARDRLPARRRADVLWPVIEGVVGDREGFVAALDALTTRSVQWVVPVAVGSADAQGGVERVTLPVWSVWDVSGSRARAVAVAVGGRAPGPATEEQDDADVVVGDASAVEAPSLSPMTRWGW